MGGLCRSQQFLPFSKQARLLPDTGLGCCPARGLEELRAWGGLHTLASTPGSTHLSFPGRQAQGALAKLLAGPLTGQRLDPDAEAQMCT